MSQEIIYTSAQKGLRSGSFGFCTVCSTGGMEPNMADFLEGISAYPHPYKPPDPRTNQNPVNFSHIIWTIGGQRFHILSRVCDAGLDYTGRTNLLAHHVALTRREAESAAGGPAWVLSDDDFTVSKWDGQLRTLPGRFPRKDDIPLEVCRHWQQASGDAGHAGVLAESCLDKSGRPVTVIYKPETDVLALVREALSLLPVEKRWGVTFSTFYTKIYSSFECQWRFIFAGSPDAAAARKNPHSHVIDLAGPSSPRRASGGALVEAARDGRFAIRTAAAPVAALSGVYVPGRTRPPNLPAIPPPNPLGEHDPRLLPPEMIPAAEEAPRTAIRNPFRGNSQKPSAMTLAVTCLASLCASLLVILGIMLLRKPPEHKVLAQVPNKSIQPPVVRTSDSNHHTGGSKGHPPGARAEAPHVTAVNVETKTEPELPDETPPAATVREPAKPVEPPPPVEPEHQPLDDIRLRDKRLPLVARTSPGGLSGASGASNGPFLANIYVNSPQECDLSLMGTDKSFGNALITLDRVDKDDVRTWPVIRKPQGGLAGGKMELLGTFRLEGQKLSFSWNPNVQPGLKPDALRFCMLKIEVGSEFEICRLASPVTLEAVKLDKFPTVKRELPRLDANQLPDIDSISLELLPVGFPGKVQQVPAEPVKGGKSQAIRVFGGTESEGAFIQLDVTFSFEKEKEGKREILIKCKERYLDGEIKVAEALIVANTLNISEMEKRISEHEKKADVFERARKKCDIQLTEQRPLLTAKINDAQKWINKLQNGDERDKEAAKTRTKEKGEHETILQNLEDKVKAEIQKRDDEKAKVRQVEETLALANEILRKGALEFRIFIVLDQEEVELYRTKGLTREY